MKGKPKSASHRATMSATRRKPVDFTDTSLRATHNWLRRNYPYTGVCEHCGNEGYTHYSFNRHPDPYTYDRSDYEELCARCHQEKDFGS